MSKLSEVNNQKRGTIHSEGGPSKKSSFPSIPNVIFDEYGEQILEIIRNVQLPEKNRFLDEILVSEVSEAIKGSKGNKTILASRLDISRSSLYRYLKLHPELEDDIQTEKVSTG